MDNNHRLLRPEELTSEIRDFWHAAAERQDRINVLTRSPEWFEMMAEGREGAVVSVFSDDDGSLAGVLPLIPVPSPWGREMLKVVGGEMLAADDLSTDEIAKWLAALYSGLAACPAIFFDHLHARQLKAVIAASSLSGVRVSVERRDLVHHRMVLPATANGLREQHSSRTAQKIRNAERRLTDVLGELKFMDIREFKVLEPIARQVDAMMESSWQARKLGREFSVKELTQVAGRGWMRCFALQGNGCVIAFAACYQGMGTLVYEIIGYDQRYAQYSPGKVLLHRLLERLYEEDRPDFVDYGEGVAEYKSGVANDSVKINRVFLTKRSIGEEMAARWHCMKASLCNRLSALRRKVAG